MSFTGIHELTLDAKNRFTVPSKERPKLSGGVMVTKAQDPCLQVWPKEAYEREAEKLLAGVNALTTSSSQMRRRVYGMAQATELDSAGRIMFKPWLIERAGLEKDVTFVGAGQYFEVWDREAWASVEPEVSESAADHIERLGDPA